MRNGPYACDHYTSAALLLLNHLPGHRMAHFPLPRLCFGPRVPHVAEQLQLKQID